jgi:hypothetical protein
MLGGLPFSLWALFMWAKIGFRYESDYSSGNKDGQFFSIFIIIGLVAFMYGFFNLKFRKCWNKKEKDQALPNKAVHRIADKPGSR